MNPEMNKIIIDMLKGTQNFVVEQAPDVVQQYLQAQYIDCMFFVCIAGAFFILAFIIILFGEIHNEMESRFGGLLLFCIGLVFIIANAPDAIKIKYAPKGYLLEKVMHR